MNELKWMLLTEPEVKAVVEAVMHEVLSARCAYPPFNTAHEGYAVLLEEVDELWTEVKVKQGKRDVEALRKEAIQVAAMAVRFVLDVCNQGGQK